MYFLTVSPQYAHDTVKEYKPDFDTTIVYLEDTKTLM
jgi:hypothetical protein